VCVSAEHKPDMEHESSGFHCLLPADRRRLDPMRLHVDITTTVRVVFVKIAVVAVLQFTVKHCQTSMFSAVYIVLCYLTINFLRLLTSEFI